MVTVSPGIHRKRNRSVASLNAARFAHRSAAVPPFPVDPNGRKDFILGTGEALAVLDLLCFHNVGKAVHLSEGPYLHTCQFLSSRSSRLTVFHTCCAAPMLSAEETTRCRRPGYS